LIAEGGVAPKSIVVLPAGKRTVVSAKPNADGTFPEIECNVTNRSALHMEAARRTLVAQGKTPFFDYCHEGVLGTNDRKSGVPTRFWWDAKRGVMADVDWTDAAQQALTGKVPEFESFSPHLPIGDASSPFPGEALGLYQNAGGIVNIGAFGSKVKFSESADMQTLCAADPNVVAELSAALRAGETPPAAQEIAMKELIGKLCAAFGLDPEKATEAEILAAFEAQHTRVAALTGRDKAVVVALGFPEADLATVSTEQLTGKITELGRRDGLVSIDDHVEALTGMAIKGGIIAPAEKETTVRRLKLDRVNETKELLAKAPSVNLGRVIPAPPAGGAAGGARPKWQARAEELIGSDPALKALPRAQAMTRALETLAKEEPAIFAEETPK
jgi:hypothetical protein